MSAMDDAAHALSLALRSGNAQHAEAAQAAYLEARGGEALPEEDAEIQSRLLGPRKVSVLSAEGTQEAVDAAESGAATEDDIEALLMNAEGQHVQGRVPGVDIDLDAIAEENDERVGLDSEDEDEVDATPAAVAKAEELGVDLSEIEGSGKDGRVVADDVVAPNES